MKNTVRIITALFLLFATLCPNCHASSGPIPAEAKPWTRWWWHGSAVTKAELTRQLELLAAAGFGGVEITPIYGVRGMEDSNINYLSAEWMQMLDHCVKEGERLGMKVDMATGTGWPFGGPNIGMKQAAKQARFITDEVSGGEKPTSVFQGGTLQALTAVSNSGETVNLTKMVDRTGRVDWTAPPGEWKLYGVVVSGTRQMVKRAAPGGAGYVMDHFSFDAISHYLERFSGAFDKSGSDAPHAFFNDSFEAYGANWTDDFFREFYERRGYDLRKHLPALFGDGDADTVSRVRSDYRETMDDLLLEDFTEPWTEWAHGLGAVTRNQAHGSPGNLLDLYAAADIPETELFGPVHFDIPGLQQGENAHDKFGQPHPLVLKFASSASHVTGKKLTSSESFTWLGEHFRVPLSLVKPHADLLFVSGINHIFYHGVVYSPEDAAWPGWLFYASVNFGPTNSQWNAMPELNTYIATVQMALQNTKPANDILLYWPVYDLWHDGINDDILNRYSMHNWDEWLAPTPFGKIAMHLWDRGYTFDYISDRQIAGLEVKNGRLLSGGNEWKTLIIPKTRHIPLETMKNILALAKNGAAVIVLDSVPGDVPGLENLEQRREELKTLLTEENKKHFRIFTSDDMELALEKAGVRREPMVDKGLQFIRRGLTFDPIKVEKLKDFSELPTDSPIVGHIYFITNTSDTPVNEWIPLAIDDEEGFTLSSFSGCRRRVWRSEDKTWGTKAYIQLEPGQSDIALSNGTGHGGIMECWMPDSVTKFGDPIEITGSWDVKFTEGAPELPEPFKTDKLKSWTELGGEKAKSFTGTAVYSIEFEKPDIKNYHGWKLDLGRVAESAVVKLNGEDLGTLWHYPFQPAKNIRLKPGTNKLEIEVTNLAANRIADMDRRGVEWKIFEDANIVDINYQPFDTSGWEPVESGLLGPVRLIPLEKN